MNWLYSSQNSNKQMGVLERDEASCSLLQGMLMSLPNQVGANNPLFNSTEPLFYEHPSVSELNPNDAAAGCMDIANLFGNFPEDAFEPVPIRPNRTPAPALGIDVLEGVLEEVLDAARDSRSLLTSGKDDVSKLYFDSLPAGTFHQEAPMQAHRTTSMSYFEKPVIVNSKKRASYNPIASGTSPPPMPKKRRTCTDAEPSLRKYQEEQWMGQFNGLVKFREQHGHCLVPHTFPENQVLSRWVKRQRYQYKLKMAGKASTMTDDRVKKLEDIGFVWDSHAITWNKRFKELQEYREKHGDCNVPSNYPENQNLAVWIKCQRRQYKLYWNSDKSSSMTMDRMRKLNDLGFLWKARDDFPLTTTSEFQWDWTKF